MELAVLSNKLGYPTTCLLKRVTDPPADLVNVKGSCRLIHASLTDRFSGLVRFRARAPAVKPTCSQQPARSRSDGVGVPKPAGFRYLSWIGRRRSAFDLPARCLAQQRFGHLAGLPPTCTRDRTISGPFFSAVSRGSTPKCCVGCAVTRQRLRISAAPSRRRLVAGRHAPHATVMWLG